MSVRAPLFVASTVTGAGAILALAPFRNLLYGAVWNPAAGGSVDIYSFQPDGSSPTLKGSIYTGVGATPPRVMLTPVQGGSATVSVDRLYCSDISGSLPTKYFVEGSGMFVVQEDLDNSGVKEDLKFQLMTSFMFHVFGTGFYVGTTGRSEVLRFSRPGLIAEDSGSGLATEPREWWPEDYRPIGQRGYRITALSTAGLSLIVFKERETYAFYGFDAQSWQVRQVSAFLGAVGPFAATSAGTVCFFWSQRGPAMTDGQTVVDLSEPVRQHVLDSKLADTHVVTYSPDDGIVYFYYPDAQDTYPTKYLAYHVEQQRFVGEGKLPFPIRCAVSMPSTAEPGPAAAPSGLTATATAWDTVSLSWANGDTSIETTTHVERNSTDIGSVGSGVSAFTDSGLSQATTYAYRVRHERNSQFSAYSGTVNVRTPLRPPTGFSATSIATGVRLTFTNTLSGTNIVVERRPLSTPAWAVLTTLTNQAAGTITYNDTAVTFGTVYAYRLKAQKTGETDSAYTEESQALAGVSPTVTALSHVSTYSSGASTFFNVSWTVSGTIPSNAMLVFYRKLGTGSFVQTVQIPASSSGVVEDRLDGYVLLSGYPTTAVQYKAELQQNGVVLSSLTDTATNEPLKQQEEF
jgi:hypothetical protein